MLEKEILILIKNEATRNKGYVALMNAYQERLYYHVRRMLKNHEDADDVLQNTFIKVFKNIEGFKAQSSLLTWIYKIATNEALTLIRKNKKLGVYTEQEEEHKDVIENLGSSDGPETEQIQKLLTQAIEALPKKQKLVFILRYYEEMSYRQMEEVLETSQGALKASFHHAAKKIEGYFKNQTIYT